MTNDRSDDIEGHRIEITFEELSTSAVDSRVEQLRAAAAPDLVRPVGSADAASSGGNSFFRSGIVSQGIAGLAGGLLGAIVVEVIGQPDSNSPWYGSSAELGSVIVFSLYALGLGVGLIGWPGIEAKSGRKFGGDLLRALPFLLGGALAGAYVAQLVYTKMTQNIAATAKQLASDNNWTSAQYYQYLVDHNHLPRAIALGIGGLAIGAAVGASRKSLRPVVNGMVGGAVGGFIGGFLFDYIGSGSSSGTTARFVAFGLTGLLIGIGTGLVEEITKQHWLEIISGGMSGKQFILYQNKVVIGSGPSCEITLIKDPAIAPEHLVLTSSSGGLALSPSSPINPVLVNGASVSSHALSDSDLIQVGSTILRYRSKSDEMPKLSMPT